MALIILALATVNSVGLAVAQDSTRIKAVADGTIMLYAEPSDVAELVANVPDATIMIVLGTDQTGNWLEVETAVGFGYVMADRAIVMDLPALAPKAYVDTPDGMTTLYAMPDATADNLGTLPVGTVGAILGFDGQFAYVDTPLGTGWAPAIDWDMLSADAAAMMVNRSELPAFADADADAAIIGTLPNGALVYRLGAGNGNMVWVLLPDGNTACVPGNHVKDLPEAYVEANARSSAGAAMYAEPVHGTEPVFYLSDGRSAFFLRSVDDTFIEIYHPEVGVAYGLARNFSTPYAVVTIAQPRSIVRDGPNDNVYRPIAVLGANTPVIATGISATGAWIEVAVPFDEIDYAYYGVYGWVRDYLFVDDFHATDLDKSILAVME